MEIRWFESLGSTQVYLVEELKAGRAAAPVCVGASFQSDGSDRAVTDGGGEKGNLSFRLAVARAAAVGSKIESASIYMAF